jgi:hypothetical protein
VVLFAVFSFLLVVQHEVNVSKHASNNVDNHLAKLKASRVQREKISNTEEILPSNEQDVAEELLDVHKIASPKLSPRDTFKLDEIHASLKIEKILRNQVENDDGKEADVEVIKENDKASDIKKNEKGKLICDGKPVDSEIIYWKEIASDMTYESPITPHHDEHKRRQQRQCHEHQVHVESESVVVVDNKCINIW